MTQKYDPSRLKIWKYWETPEGSEIPWHIEKLLRQPEKYSSHELVILNEKNIKKYLPGFSIEGTCIEKKPHKKDFLASRILHSYGGIFLDCDSILVSNIDCLFDDLVDHTMFTFTENGKFNEKRDTALIQCMGCRPGCYQMVTWMDLQSERVKRSKKLQWLEIGTQALNEAIKRNQNGVKIRPASQIEPIHWNDREKFNQTIDLNTLIQNDTLMFMYFNATLKVNKEKKDSVFNQLMEKYV